MPNFKLWVMTLIEYKGGETKILKSFTRPAKDSETKNKEKKPIQKLEIKKSDKEVDLFDVE